MLIRIVSLNTFIILSLIPQQVMGPARFHCAFPFKKGNSNNLFWLSNSIRKDYKYITKMSSKEEYDEV